MRLFVFTLSAVILALPGCGERESSSSSPVAVDAESPANARSAAEKPAPLEAEPAEPSDLSQAAESCLALVDEAKYDEAVLTCSRALQQNPSDPNLEKILALARQLQKETDSMDREIRAQEAEEARRALSDPGR